MERTFGIELECYYPENNLSLLSERMNQIGRAEQIDYYNSTNTNAYSVWDIGYDPTIHPPHVSGRNYSVAEIRSPIFKDNRGVREIGRMAWALRSAGARVNRSTGTHVHIGHMGQFTRERVAAMVETVFTPYENAFFALSGRDFLNRKESDYCEPWEGNTVFEETEPPCFCEGDYTCSYCSGEREWRGDEKAYERYMALNLTNWLDHDHPTFEFRCFAGTMNGNKAQAAVLMSYALVEYAAKNWTTHDVPSLDPRVAMQKFTEVFFQPEYLPQGMNRVPSSVLATMYHQAAKAATVAGYGA